MLTNIDVNRNQSGSTCWFQCVRSVDLAFGALKKNMCYGGKNTHADYVHLYLFFDIP